MSSQNSLTFIWHWSNIQNSLTFFQNSLTIPWPGENFVFPWLFPDTWQPWRNVSDLRNSLISMENFNTFSMVHFRTFHTREILKVPQNKFQMSYELRQLPCSHHPSVATSKEIGRFFINSEDWWYGSVFCIICREKKKKCYICVNIRFYFSTTTSISVLKCKQHAFFNNWYLWYFWDLCL